MKIEYLHASRFGNGAAVAAEFKQQMAAQGVVVDVHHIRELSATQLASADLYVFSSLWAHGQADPEHASLPEEGEATRRHQLRHPDH